MANIGPLSENTIREIKDDLEERIGQIHSMNKRIVESNNYRSARAVTDNEEDATDNEAEAETKSQGGGDLGWRGRDRDRTRTSN